MRKSSTTIVPNDGDKKVETFFAYLPCTFSKHEWVTDSWGIRRSRYTDETRWLERVTVEMKYRVPHGYSEGQWIPERFVD